MQNFLCGLFLTIYFCDKKKNCADYTLAKVNSQKNCAQKKDIFVYLLEERGKALSAAL